VPDPPSVPGARFPRSPESSVAAARDRPERFTTTSQFGDVKFSLIILKRRGGVTKPAAKEKETDSQREQQGVKRQKRGRLGTKYNSGFSGIQDGIRSIRASQPTADDIKE